MKSMILGFAAVAVLAVGAWYALEAVDYTETRRVEGNAVRLD